MSRAHQRPSREHPGREQWASRLGFVMAAAGSAVGLGNIWKFPYMAGDNGGGAFLILYLMFVGVFGLSLIMAELVMGRATQRNAVGAYRRLAGRGWPLIGVMGLVAAFMILSFYTVIAGWTVAYLGFAVDGAIHRAAGSNQADALDALFNSLVTNAWQPLIYAALFMAATAGVVAGGIGRGIERVSKLFMPILFVILVVMVIRAVTLPGAWAGLRFFLVPDWSAVSSATLIAAISQAFFSLSLGVGGMITYGSYMQRSQNLPKDALAVVGLDTLVALLAGLMVLPALFAAGFDPGSGGVGTTFKVLPAVFAAMPGGGVFAFGFFALLVLAALTSSVSLLEVIICYAMDERGLSRRTAVAITSISCFALAVPVSLSFGPWTHVQLFGQTIFGLMDLIASSIMLPLGGIAVAVCVGWILGPRAVTAVRMNHGDGGRAPLWTHLWLFVLRFVAPLGIGWVLLQAI